MIDKLKYDGRVVVDGTTYFAYASVDQRKRDGDDDRDNRDDDSFYRGSGDHQSSDHHLAFHGDYLLV